MHIIGSRFSVPALTGFWALLIIGGVGVVTGGAMFSPGPLNAQSSTGPLPGATTAHAELATQCAACHPEPWSRRTMNDRCQSCHNNIPGPSEARGLHTRFSDPRNCVFCHSEHRGPAASLTRSPVRGVPHASFGFTLDVHQVRPDGGPFECKACHGIRFTRPAVTSCEPCHQTRQPKFTAEHVDQMGHECTGCHDGSRVQR